jgi:hypothetical protein
MTHLSSEQISAWLLGECDAEGQRHVENCRQCQDEIVELRDGLHLFRRSVHHWAEHFESENMPVRKHSSSVSWTLAAASALAIGLTLLPLYFGVRQHTQLEAQRAQDSVLLDQIHTRITRTVPQSMERLMELMSEGKEVQQ